MNELVFLKHKQALTTSLIVADKFEKNHQHVMRDIRNLSGEMDVSDFGQMFRKATYHDSYGRNQPMYLINRDGVALLGMGFTGANATQFKLAFIKAFNAMEVLLAERVTVKWQAARFDVKEGYKTLSAVVHDLHEFAVTHGCKVSERVFYMNFAKLINKTLGIDAGTRDELAAWQLYEIEKLQFIARTVIKGLLAQGVDYHEPYRQTKSTLEAYARLSFIPQRLLSA